MIDESTVALLRDELAALRAEVARLRAERSGSPDRTATTTDRRGFFRLAAGAAAGVVVAGAATAEPATAATGDPLVVGQVNVASTVGATTLLESPSETTLMPRAFVVANYSTRSVLPTDDRRIAVHGITTDTDLSQGFRIGILGQADPAGDADDRGVGVYGESAFAADGLAAPTEPVGVLGHAGGGGTGVKGHVTSAGTTGVHGRADHAAAVGVLASAAGTALRVDGGLLHVPAPVTGPPVTGAVGQQHRDALGDLYLCTAGGPPATWRKVAAQHPAFAVAGGSVNLLDRPIRLLDTRPSGTAPITLGKVRPTVGVDTAAVDVTGVAVDGVQVPEGATGIIGTLTAAEALGTGYVAIFPGSSAFPGTSSLNFTAAAPIATGITCRLGGDGTIRLRVGSAATHVVLDVVGFLF